jgi:methylated-DNA-[protein]-cysteine S-methyltransferase
MGAASRIAARKSRPSRPGKALRREVRPVNRIDMPVETAAFDSRLGWIVIVASTSGPRGLPVLSSVSFGHPSFAAAIRSLGSEIAEVTRPRALWPDLVDRLSAYAKGECVEFADLTLDLSQCTPFERRVVEHCRRIAYGTTISYGQLATLAGSPRAARAVGNAMACNRFPLVVPCHRVVHASGALGSYSAPAGTRMKLRLLEQEGAWQGGKPRPAASLAAAGNLA